MNRSGVNPWSGMPWSESSFGQEDRDYIKHYSRRWGQTYFIIGSQWPVRITQRPSELKEFIETVHKYDCKVMVYMDLRWNNPDRVCYAGDLTYEQMRDARMRHHLDNGTFCRELGMEKSVVGLVPSSVHRV